MNTVNLVQGSPEWMAHRANFFNASDAPAMMGVSPYKTRSDLLKEMATGIRPEVSDAQQELFSEGHRCEALYREIAEQIVGEELFPVVGTEGKLSASFDGLTMSEDVAYEHKLLNAELRTAFDDIDTVAPEYRETQAGRLLPMAYQVQMEQQCMIGGCGRVLFAASRWSRNGELEEERHCWYYPNAELAAKIEAGWEQFEKDLAAYEPPVAEAKPIGRTPETLPALRLEVTGAVTASNLSEFREHALAVFAGINRDLTTDQEFADAEKTVKWCSEVESRLAAAKEHALSQTASIDQLFKTIDDISAEARRVRLDLDKLVTRRKVEIKESIVVGARGAYVAHINALKAETGGAWTDLGMPDFAGAAKGKRSVASIQDAADTLLANSKITADAAAKRIRANIAYFDEAIKGHEALFADRLGLVVKQIDDLRLVVDTRISKHKADEQAKEEATRERIRREEQAKAERDAAAKVAAEKAEQEAAARAAQAVAAPTTSPAPASVRTAPPAQRQPAPVTQLTPRQHPPRPTDADIIAALVSHFEATEDEVIGWLCELDFSTLGHAA